MTASSLKGSWKTKRLPECATFRAALPRCHTRCDTQKVTFVWCTWSIPLTAKAHRPGARAVPSPPGHCQRWQDPSLARPGWKAVLWSDPGQEEGGRTEQRPRHVHRLRGCIFKNLENGNPQPPWETWFESNSYSNFDGKYLQK